MSLQNVKNKTINKGKSDAVIQPTVEVLDARRRLEDRFEEARLRRETQEFDFDTK